MPTKHKPSLKEVAPQTYEKAKAVELTQSEQERLSRATLLRWLEAKKYEKLKGLQEQLIELAISERDELREKIIKNTKKELATQKELTRAQKQERAEKFADALIGVADGIGNVKSVIERFGQEINEERMFHEYIGSVGGVLGVSNLKKIKSIPQVKKFLESEPGLSEEIDEAIDSGDYDNVRSVLLRVPYFAKHADELDMLMNIAMEEPQRLPGIMGMIEQGVNWVGGLPKKVLEGFKSANGLLKRKVYKPVAKKLGVKYGTLRNLSGLTLSQLIDRNRIFQKYKHLLEERLKTTKNKKEIKKLEIQLEFIEDTGKITEGVNQAKEKHGDLIGKAYLDRLQKLKKAGKISEEDFVRISVELDLDSVRVDSFFPLIRYEDVKDKDQDSNLYLISQLLTRRHRIREGLKFLGLDVSVRAAHGIAGTQRFFSRNVREFRKTFKKFPNGESLTSIFDDLSKKVSNYEISSEKIGKRSRTKAYLHDLKSHDEIMRMYYESSQHASRVLSAEAQRVVNAGKELDVLLQGGKFKPSKIPKGVLDVLYGGGKIPKSLSKGKLERAYTQRLIDVRIARDTAQQTFSSLSAKLRTGVMDKFENRWLKGADIADVKKTLLKETGEIKKFVSPGRRFGHRLKMFGLPAIALGIPVIDMARGKARYRDIKYDLLDTALGFVPIVGTINDFKQMWTGRTTSGRKLGTRDRIMSGVFSVIGAVSDVAWTLGGLGGVMRAGLGSLRSARRIARVGKLSKGIKEIKVAEGVTIIQRMGMRIGGFFNGFSGAKRMENFAESAAKIKVYNYLNVQKELRGVKGFEKISDIKSAEKFAASLQGTRHAEAAGQYLKMMSHTRGIDYYKSLSRSFGFADQMPHFVGTKMKFNQALNYIRKGFLKGGGRAKKLKEMEETADVYQAYKLKKVKALEDYNEAVKKGEGVEEALKNLRQVESKLVSGAKEYARVQEEVFATAERLSRTHLLVSKAAKYFTYGGFAMGGYFMLTGKAPSVAGIKKYGKPVVGAAWGAAKFVGRNATTIHGYQPPIDDIIDEAIKTKKDSTEFAKRIKAIEDTHDPKKKEKIYTVCARYWSSSAVRAWVYRHKDKLDIKKILEKAKKLYMPSRGKVRGALQRVKEVMGGGKPSL